MAGEERPAAWDRVHREAEYHDHRYAHDARAGSSKFYGLSAGHAYFRERVRELAAGGVVLDCGCGTGGTAVTIAPLATSVTGVDISPVAIEKATKRARRAGAHNATFSVERVEALPFPDASFDLVVGSGVLHHVALPDACASIARVLRPGGRALFLEPLAYNPVVRVYRRLTPAQRSVDEHPLRIQDLRVLRGAFARSDERYFDLLSMVPAVFGPARRFTPRLERADAWMFRHVAALRPIAWMVVVEATA